MAQRPGQDERRRLKQDYLASERTEARAYMILDEAALTDLVEHVDAAVEVQGCDHSLRATLAWAAAHKCEPDALKASLAHFGGYCDCEVAANVNPEDIFK